MQDNMTFKKGHIPWSKGKVGVFSEETRKKLSESRTGEKNPNFGKRGEKSSFYGKHHSEESRKKISDSQRGEKGNMYGKHHSEETRRKLSASLSGENSPMYGKHLSEDTRKKISESNRGEKHPMYGKHHSKEARKKMRVSAITYLENNGGISPRIGSNEKALLDIQEQNDSVKILRNYKISELGYFVDGYCSETNTVYEVYERFHDKQVQKDLQREIEICNHLGCDFIIILDESK